MVFNDMEVRSGGERHTSSGIRGLVNTNEAMTEFEHVVSIRRNQHHCKIRATGHSPKGDDDELSILGSIFNVVSHDGYISEVKGRINFIHEIERCWLGFFVSFFQICYC